MCSAVAAAVEAVLAAAGGADEEILVPDELIAHAEAKLVGLLGLWRGIDETWPTPSSSR